MEAGGELNALMAEKVMGWRLSSDGLLWFEEGHVLPVELVDEWDPSGDISAAWPLAEKLGLMLIPVTVYPSEDSWDAHKKEETETWWACVSAYVTMYLPVEAYRDEWGGYVGWVEKEVGVDDVAKTAPLAICLAALKAVEHEN